MKANRPFKLRILRKFAFCPFGMVLAISCFCLAAESATVTALNGSGASLFTNPLSGSTATSDQPIQFSIDQVVNGEDSNADTSTSGRLRDASGVATSGYMNFAPSSSFTAGTIISAQAINGNFDGPMAWDLTLDGTSVDSGAGTPGTHTIAVKQLNLSQAGTYNEARITGDMVQYSGDGRTYFAFNELLILPERMNRLDTTASILSGSGAGLGNIEDLNGANWWIGSGSDSFRLTLDGTRRVSTLVLANLQNQGNTAFNILNDQELTMAGVTMTANGTSGEFIAINFATPVTTDYLDFNFTSGTPNFREIMALETAVPEPGSMALLIFGTATLLYLRRAMGRK